MSRNLTSVDRVASAALERAWQMEQFAHRLASTDAKEAVLDACSVPRTWFILGRYAALVLMAGAVAWLVMVAFMLWVADSYMETPPIGSLWNLAAMLASIVLGVIAAFLFPGVVRRSPLGALWQATYAERRAYFQRDPWRVHAAHAAWTLKSKTRGD